MARFRLSRPAQIDLANILVTSSERWGDEGRRRYSALISAAMRRVAERPDGANTQERPDLMVGLRSYHIRHARLQNRAEKVARPVHVIFYRTTAADLVEIVRVLHERMEPSRHISRSTPGET